MCTRSRKLIFKKINKSVERSIAIIKMAHVLFGTIDQLVLVRALVAGLDASILPQNLRIIVEFLGKEKPNNEKRNAGHDITR